LPHPISDGDHTAVASCTLHKALVNESGSGDEIFFDHHLINCHFKSGLQEFQSAILHQVGQLDKLNAATIHDGDVASTNSFHLRAVRVSPSVTCEIVAAYTIHQQTTVTKNTIHIVNPDFISLKKVFIN